MPSDDRKPMFIENPPKPRNATWAHRSAEEWREHVARRRDEHVKSYPEIRTKADQELQKIKRRVDAALASPKYQAPRPANEATTPRPAGSKRTWVKLDKQDRERLFNALFVVETALDKDPPSGGPPILFRDPRRRYIREGWFMTSDVYTQVNYGESCNISLTVSDDLDLGKARESLEYLGFSEPLIEQMLPYYEARKDVQAPFASWSPVEISKGVTKAASDDPQNEDPFYRATGAPGVKEITLDDRELYEPFYRYLASLTGRQLRAILTPDEESAAKWKTRLARQGKAWRDIRLPLSTIARLICKAITAAGIRQAIEFDAVVKRLKRLEPSPQK